MTTAASAYPLLGSQPVGNFFIPDNVQRHVLGTVLGANDPYWGGQEVVYLAIPASTPLVTGTPVVWDVANSVIAVPNTANLGMPLALSLNAVPTSTSVQYSWFVIEGRTVAASNASVAAASPIGIAAAGRLGANTAGKQVLNARVNAAATTTVVKTNVATQSGSPLLRTSQGNTDGWFVGVVVTGTGIPASTTIIAIDPDNRTVTMSANATATGNVTVTGTYNDGTIFYNVVTIDRPFAQGAIT
tara:strand:- start:1584 stop:2315 length:732 start_codon:yes stop_codon:yes gene_type:complete